MMFMVHSCGVWRLLPAISESRLLIPCIMLDRVIITTIPSSVTAVLLTRRAVTFDLREAFSAEPRRIACALDASSQTIVATTPTPFHPHQSVPLAMSFVTSLPPPTLHREVRLSPTPICPTSILHIDTTALSSRLAFTSTRKRPFDEISGIDSEESYARKHLATEGSVFFRARSRAPRSFLWRVLGDRKVLEVQAVDLLQKGGQPGGEGFLTYQIGFKDAIALDGVVLADVEATDTLELFVLTEGKTLFTITLGKSLLTRETVPREFDVSACVKQYASSLLSLRQVYRFVAVSSLELLISLADGGIVRLQRQAGEDGTQWRETLFSEGGFYGTLRGMVPFRNRQTVRYGETDLETGAMAAMAMSPGGEYVWTISLDHKIKAWSTRTGKVVAARDLLDDGDGDARDRRQQQYVMAAEQGTLLQIVQLPSEETESREVARLGDSQYYLAVHSPKDHQLKLYGVRHASNAATESNATSGTIILDDLQPTFQMTPPVDTLMNTNIWHLEDFHIQPGGSNWENTQIWLRARSGTVCKLYTLTLDLMDEDVMAADIADIWKYGWTTVCNGPTTSESLKDAADHPGDLEIALDDPRTLTERWLAFLFYPSRFSNASLETALAIYRKGRGLPASSAASLRRASDSPLRERLVTAITSKVMLRRLPNEAELDYGRYQSDIQAQWQVLYSLLSHLHGRRGESVGFAFDPETSLAWSICADFVAPVRALSELEKKVTNAAYLETDAETGVARLQQMHSSVEDQLFPAGLTEGDEDGGGYVTRFMAAASGFRRSLPSAVQGKLREQMDLLIFGQVDAEHPLQQLFDSSNLLAGISSESFDALEAAMEGLGGLGSLQSETFMTALGWLEKEGDVIGRDGEMMLDRFGAKLTLEVGRETLEASRDVLEDLLALAVLMACDLEGYDDAFYPTDTFDAMIPMFRRNALLRWLVSAERSLPGDQGRTTSVMQDIFIGDWTAATGSSATETSVTEGLTKWSKKWVLGLDLKDSWDGITGAVLASLVKRREIDLALDFLHFMTDTPWSRYVQGRLQLVLGEYTLANNEVLASAEGMAAARGVGSMDTEGLLTAEEHEYFGAGLSQFTLHIALLFDSLKAPSYTADFAALALQHLENGQSKNFKRSIAELDAQKASAQGSPMDQAKLGIEESRLLRWKIKRDEMLNLLFSALLSTGRLQKAYEALERMEDEPTQSASLKKLVEHCVKLDDIPSLLALPFTEEMAAEADTILAALARKELNTNSRSTPKPAYQILYAFRTARSDFRGAAEILYAYLSSLRASDSLAVQDPENETLVQAYLLLINTMACCGESDAWVLAEGDAEKGRKRRLVTLGDVRREYTAEMDRRSEMLLGRFGVVGGAGVGEAMDVL